MLESLKCFHVNIAEFLRTPFFTEHLRWLLPIFQKLLQILKKPYCISKIYFAASYTVEPTTTTISPITPTRSGWGRYYYVTLNVTNNNNKAIDITYNVEDILQKQTIPPNGFGTVATSIWATSPPPPMKFIAYETGTSTVVKMNGKDQLLFDPITYIAPESVYITGKLFSLSNTYEMSCAIWYNLHNLKNVKNNHGEVLLLVKLQASAFSKATLRKVTLLHGGFSRFLNCTNGTKSRNAIHM